MGGPEADPPAPRCTVGTQSRGTHPHGTPPGTWEHRLAMPPWEPHADNARGWDDSARTHLRPPASQARGTGAVASQPYTPALQPSDPAPLPL